MEDAFDALAIDVADRIAGVPEKDVNADPKLEAVIYEYFGELANEHPSSEHGKVLGEHPLLLHFHQLLNEQNPTDPVAAEEVQILKDAFNNLHERLRDQKLNPQELSAAFIAMEGIVVYAYNNLLTNWYGTASRKIPETPPRDPPEEFLTAFKKDPANQETRTKAWQLIRKFCE